MGIEYAKVTYFDASALVKVYYIPERINEVVDYYYGNSICTTTLCLTETLGVMKAKWKYGHVSEAEYFDHTKHLLADAWGKKLKIEDVNILNLASMLAIENVAKKYSLDWSDALQLETIKSGKYSHFAEGSKTCFVTADEGLANAAKAEGIRTWNCIKEPQPQWA